MRIEQKVAVVKALGKVLWIQNDLFAKWYVRDGDEFEEYQNPVEIEQEGYLHGKKVINESLDEGVCPFSGLTKDLAGVSVAANREQPKETENPITPRVHADSSKSSIPRPVES